MKKEYEIFSEILTTIITERIYSFTELITRFQEEIEYLAVIEKHVDFISVIIYEVNEEDFGDEEDDDSWD